MSILVLRMSHWVVLELDRTSQLTYGELGGTYGGTWFCFWSLPPGGVDLVVGVVFFGIED